MTKDRFLSEIKNIFNTDFDIEENMVLENMEEWDSITKMVVIAFFKKELSIDLLPDELVQMEKVSDLIKKANL